MQEARALQKTLAIDLGLETRTAAAGVAIKRIRELQPQFEI